MVGTFGAPAEGNRIQVGAGVVGRDTAPPAGVSRSLCGARAGLTTRATWDSRSEGQNPYRLSWVDLGANVEKGTQSIIDVRVTPLLGDHRD